MCFLVHAGHLPFKDKKRYNNISKCTRGTNKVASLGMQNVFIVDTTVFSDFCCCERPQGNRNEDQAPVTSHCRAGVPTWHAKVSPTISQS